MKDGDLKVGAIAAVEDASVTFVYKGETLKYILKKSDITKIIFSNSPNRVVVNFHYSLD